MFQNQVSQHKPWYIVISCHSKIDPYREVIARTRKLMKTPAAKHCLVANLLYVVLTSSIFVIMSEVINSRRTRVPLTKPLSKVSRALVKHRTQKWLVILDLTLFADIVLIRVLMLRIRNHSYRARPSQRIMQQAQVLPAPAP